MKAWVYVFLAGLLEIAWALGLKLSTTRPKLWIPTVIGMILSFALLSQGMKSLPVGTAYAVWTGIGSAGTAVAGIWWFGEARDPLRLFFLALVVVGIIGLRFGAR